MKVTIRNDFHGTSYNLRVKSLPIELTESQIRRCRRALCGMDDCICGGPIDNRGPQDVDIEEVDQFFERYPTIILRNRDPQERSDLNLDD